MIVSQGNLIGFANPATHETISLVEVPASLFKINGKCALTQIVATFNLKLSPFTPDIIIIKGTSKIKCDGLPLIQQSDLTTSALGNRVMVKPTDPPYAFSN